MSHIESLDGVVLLSSRRSWQPPASRSSNKFVPAEPTFASADTDSAGLFARPLPRFFDPDLECETDFGNHEEEEEEVDPEFAGHPIFLKASARERKKRLHPDDTSLEKELTHPGVVPFSYRRRYRIGPSSDLAPTGTMQPVTLSLLSESLSFVETLSSLHDSRDGIQASLETRRSSAVSFPIPPSLLAVLPRGSMASKSSQSPTVEASRELVDTHLSACAVRKQKTRAQLDDIRHRLTSTCTELISHDLFQLRSPVDTQLAELLESAANELQQLVPL